MKKQIITLLITCATIVACAQTQEFDAKIKLNKVAIGNTADSLLVIDSAQEVKKISPADLLSETVETDPTVASHIKAITTTNIADWNDAAANSHTHANKAILDATTASFTDEQSLMIVSNDNMSNFNTGLIADLETEVASLTYDVSNKENSFTKNTAFNKNFGTTSGTVAEGNDSRINNGQTAFGWGNHATQGYVDSAALNDYVTKSAAETISGSKLFTSKTSFNSPSANGFVTIMSGSNGFPILGSSSRSALSIHGYYTNYGLNFTIDGSGKAAIQNQRFDGLNYVYDICLQPSGGNVSVGAGTNTASYRLDVSGTGRFTDDLTVNGMASIDGDLTIGGDLNMLGTFITNTNTVINGVAFSDVVDYNNSNITNVNAVNSLYCNTYLLNINVTSFLNLPTTLPTGTIACVSDASSVTYRGIASGGGNETALVMWDGSNWIYH